MPGFWDQLQQYAAQDTQRAEANEGRKMQIAQMLMGQAQTDSEMAARSLDSVNSSLLGQLSELNKSDQFGRGLTHEIAMQDDSQASSWAELIEKIKNDEKMQKLGFGNAIDVAKINASKPDLQATIDLISLLLSTLPKPTQGDQLDNNYIPPGSGRRGN